MIAKKNTDAVWDAYRAAFLAPPGKLALRRLCETFCDLVDGALDGFDRRDSLLRWADDGGR